MPKFRYVAKSRTAGNISGTIIAESQSEAIRELRKKNLLILDVRKVDLGRGIGLATFFQKTQKKRRGKRDELVLFTRQLATMISAGIALLESMEVLVDQIDDARLRGAVRQVVDDVRSGSDLSKALEKHPRIFSKVYVSMVRAGELSGQLDEILMRLADYLEGVARLRKDIRAAMTYPIVSLLLVLSITLFLIMFVVPKFEPIFQNLGIELPGITRFVLDLSRLVTDQWLVIAASILVLGAAIRLYARTGRGRRHVDYLKLKTPVFGPLFTKVALSRFSRTFATLIKSGVPILGALEVVSETVNNRVIQDVIENAKESVRQGDTLSDPLAQSPLFPPMVTRMISIGEKSGTLETLLEKIAVFYDEQVSSAIKSLTSLIEPIMIGLMGILVGVIVLAVFLPIFALQGKLTNPGG